MPNVSSPRRIPLLPLLGCLGLFATLVVVTSLSMGGGDAGAATTPAAVRTVSSTATGTANGVPDNLIANVGVHTTGDTAAAVLADNNTRTKALLEKLKAEGVADKDVRTTSVNLGPHYTNNGVIDGYSADNQLEVTFRDLASAGGKLDGLVQTAGDAAQIQSVRLGFNDDDALKSAARVDGVKRARAQAEEMAKAAGAELGAVRTITEVVASTPTFMPEAYGAADAAASSVPISAGSQDLTVEVRVTFDLA